MLRSGPRRLGMELAALLGSGGAGVLATIVRTEGHTYRKAGAQMLISGTGDMLGLLSGGCLEDQIAGEAMKALALGEPQLLYFDLTASEEYLVGYGKGCFGRLWILLEIVGPERGPVTSALMRRLCNVTAPTGTALVYEVEGDGHAMVGSRVVVGGGQETATDLGDGVAAACIAEHVRSGMAEGKPLLGVAVAAGVSVRYSVHFQRPVQDVVLFGAGPDALPVVALACQLGWEARVYDHRQAYARAERVAGAASVRLYNPDAIDAVVTAKPLSAVVVMTHNLLVDLRVLRWAAGQPVPYVGLLGPAHRRDRLLAMARDDGDDLGQRLSGRLYSPVGLDLGGEAETDIALAVIAQIQQVRLGGKGSHRGVVAAPDEGRARPLPYQSDSSDAVVEL